MPNGINAFFRYTIICFAHSFGQSLEKIEGSYTIDVGYNSIDATPPAGEPVHFDAKLYNNVTHDPVPFNAASFNITQNSLPIAAGTVIKSEFGSTGMTMTFPKSGSCTVAILFKNNISMEIIKTFFTIQVLPADYESVTGKQSKNYKLLISGILLGIVLGVGLDSIFISLKKRK